MKYCWHVSKGMAYLSALGFVHRDLAARNVLIDASDKCKIADFGLARDRDQDEYYVAKQGKVPIRWTAPEVTRAIITFALLVRYSSPALRCFWRVGM